MRGPLLLASVFVVFAAGTVRGFAGFGFSALVAALSLFMPPAEVVPPICVALLDYVDEMPLRLLIGALLLLAATLLRSGWTLALAPTRGVRLFTGLVSGLINGVAAIGGIVVAVLLSTAAMAPAAVRANMILLLLFTDLYALGWAALLPGGAGQELLGAGTLQLALWLTPAMLAGIWVGQRAFVGLSPQRFRRGVLQLLMLIAGLSVLRATAALLG